MRESLLKLLRGEKPDRVVWTADTTYWISGREQDGTADPSWKTEPGYLQFHRRLGVMPYYWYARFWLGVAQYDDTVRVSTSTENGVTVETWHTPAGTLRAESSFMPESCSTGITKHAVQSRDDLKVFLYLLEHRHLVPDCLDDYQARMAAWKPYDGLPCIAMPRSPLPAFFTEWAGVQNAVYLMMDCEDMVRKALALMQEQEEPILDAVCEAKVPLVHFADNLTSENFTGCYDEYMAEVYDYRLSRLHEAGTSCAVHLDGTVRGLLPKLSASGFDAVEALTPQPAGDLTGGEMRDLAANDNLILWGGMPGAMFAAPYTWDDVKRHIDKLLESWKGTRFVVGVADQIPPDGNVEFCRHIADMLP